MLTWFVRYKNSQEIPNSKDFTYEDIDRSNLDAFIIVDDRTDLPVITVHFDDTRKKLLYRRRTELPTRIRNYRIVCHLLGWIMSVKDEELQNINYVYETFGRKNTEGIDEDVFWIESAGKWDITRNDWFYPPEPRPIEK